MLKLDLRPGEAITIGNATVTLESKSGQIARLVIVADKSIPVERVIPVNSVAALVAKQGIKRPE